MTKMNNSIDAVLSFVGVVALVTMTVHVVTSALMRYFLGAPLYGTNEITEYWYLPVIALLGIPAAQMQKEHISVTLLVDRMRSTSARLFRTGAYAISAVVSTAFVWFGLQEALDKMAVNATAGAISIVIWPAYFVVPLAFGILTYCLISDAVMDRRAPRDLSSSVEDNGTILSDDTSTQEFDRKEPS